MSAALALAAFAAQAAVSGTAYADDPGPADATVGKALVTLGDSFSANGVATDSSCQHKPTSWPNQLAALEGVAGTDDFLDESCNGGSLDYGNTYTLAIQAKAAADAGAFGPHTKMVTLQFGDNDTWGGEPRPDALSCVIAPFVPTADREQFVRDRCTGDWPGSPDDHGLNGATYAALIQKEVTYVKYYAPNAKIEIVGYPEQHAGSLFCLNVLGLGNVWEDNPAVSAHSDRLEAAERDAADLLGIDYLDTRALTAGHSGCSADPWVNGVSDQPDYRLGCPMHPTPVGDSVTAHALAARWPQDTANSGR